MTKLLQLSSLKSPRAKLYILIDQLKFLLCWNPYVSGLHIMKLGTIDPYSRSEVLMNLVSSISLAYNYKCSFISGNELDVPECQIYDLWASTNHLILGSPRLI